MPREFASSADVVDGGASSTCYEAPRLVRQTVVDFGSLGLPADVRRALAEAFWCHFGVMAERCIHMRWHYLNVFDRFARESGAITSLADLHGGVLVRYVEWLNDQRRPDGQPWTKSSRASAYTILRKLLQWIERCRPGVIASVEYPFNPFPWRNRDGRSRSKMPAGELRALLRACEADITRIRAGREAAAAQRVANARKPGTLGWLLEHIDRRCGGIVPTARELSRAGQHPVNKALHKFGGVRQVEPCLYPRGESLLPYYLAIMIHAAGNPEPIAELGRDCLQSLPLLDDRQALVWFKARANSMQRRTFSSADRFEPPALVKEILAWNEQLRPLTPATVRDRLFLYKSPRGATALTTSAVKHMIKPFCERHGLPRFSLVSIRPGVLASFYRASGDLRRAKAVANHAHLSTTVRYVQTPEVEAQHRTRIAALQQAFLGHIERDGSGNASGRCTSKLTGNGSAVPVGELVSMFGFGCKDPFAGVASGTRPGELCTNFMGCFTCPNAIITPDPSTLARLLQARDHMRAARSSAAPGALAGLLCPAAAHPGGGHPSSLFHSRTRGRASLGGAVAAAAQSSIRSPPMRAASGLQTSTRTPKGRAGAHAPDDRAWFLDSLWHDPVWIFKPTNVLEEAKPVRVDWRFKLPSGHVFVEPRYAPLLHSSKQLIALIRSRSLSTGLAQRASTAAGYFMYLRELVRWMDRAGFTRFADLDATALLQFRRSIAQRPGMQRDALAPATVQKYLYLLTYLSRFCDELDDGLRIDPFPGRSNGEVAGARDADIRHWAYTPQAVAVPLIQGAIGLINHGAAPILQARDVYAEAISAANQRGLLIDACTNSATRALQHARIELPGQQRPILTVDDLASSIDMLYAACFVVISYLVGPRSSEILHLEVGCVQRRAGTASDDEVTVIVGAIFKRQPEYSGRPHEWVALPLAVAAIAVLEALSAGHRAQAGRPQLWLRRRQTPGATEWQRPCPGALGILSTVRMCSLLQRFAVWLGLPLHEGKAWRLSTHQGRKTFARFAALRDGSALFALAQHLGHRERAVTDYGYAGSDYRLNQEIEVEILEQSAAAWEHMLATPGLGGRAGAEIMAKRPRFRGARLKQDIKSYARLLVDAGLVLGVCDWGFCVYREEHSACLGNAIGPNPARREPSACARCKNFAVSDQHRPYWIEQVRRHEALLDEPALPLQTLRIARVRLDQARSLIRAIDATNKEARHGAGNR